MIRLAVCAGALSVFAIAACGNDDPAAFDANPSADGPATIDALTFDSTPPDAAGPCPGGVEFTGGYEDWDSTDQDFLGIVDATYTEVGNKSNTATTAPNGRVEMCLEPIGNSVLTITHNTYLDAVYSMSSEANAAGPFAIRGLTAARADQLFTDISETRDVGDAQVIVAVRLYPGGTPVVGAQVSVGNTNDGAFTPNASGAYVSGATTTDDAFVLFANTQLGADTTTVTVTPPNGTTCDGVANIVVAAGELAFTTFACTD